MIYYVIFILLGTLFLFDIVSKKKFKLLWYFYFVVTCIFLIFFAGLRYNIGIDYVSHERIYESIQSGLLENFSNTNQEKGYFILNKIFNDFNVMLFFIALVTLTIKFKVIKNNSIYIFLTLFLYYCLFFVRYDMGLVTQGIATAIIMYSYNYIIEEKPFKFIFLVLMASLFHISAIIFMPFYWVLKKDYTVKFIVIVIVGSFFMAFSSMFNQIFEYISVLIPRYSVYINNEASFEISVNMFKRIIFLLIFTYTIKKYYRDNKTYRIFLNMYFLGAVIYYVFKPFWILSDRGSIYFTLSEIFLWGIILKHYKGIIKRSILAFLIILYGLYSLNKAIDLDDEVLKMTSFNRAYIPYQFILDKK